MRARGADATKPVRRASNQAMTLLLTNGPSAATSTVSTVSALTVHSIGALRYRAQWEPVDLAPLVIRQSRDFMWTGIRGTAFILGASHALQLVFPNGSTFVELLTCLPPRFTDAGLAMPATERDAPITKTLHGANGLRGEVRLSRFVLAPGADDLFGAFAPENTLHEPFPLPNGETAWTRIGWQTDGTVLRVETVHTYPDENAAIRSQTILQYFDTGRQK